MAKKPKRPTLAILDCLVSLQMRSKRSGKSRVEMDLDDGSGGTMSESSEGV